MTLVFPPREPRGFTLLVDGTAEVAGDDVRITPATAVLHRPASHADGPPAPDGCGNDCAPLPAPHDPALDRPPSSTSPTTATRRVPTSGQAVTGFARSPQRGERRPVRHAGAARRHGLPARPAGRRRDAADPPRPPRRRPRARPPTRRSSWVPTVVGRPYDDVTIMSSPGGFVFCLVPGARRRAAAARHLARRPHVVRRPGLPRHPAQPVRRRAGLLARADRLAAARPGARLGVRPAHTGPGAAAPAAAAAARRRAGHGHRPPRLGRVRPRGRAGRARRRRCRGAGPLRVVDRAPRPRRPDLLRHPAPTGRPAGVNDEIGNLTRFLEDHRAIFRRKAGGLSRDQLQQTLSPSDLTLGGMVKHLAFVEDWWFGRHLSDAQAEPWASRRLGGRPGLGLALRGRRRPRAALGAVGGRGRPLAGRGGRGPTSRADRPQGRARTGARPSPCAGSSRT